jgi:hypothetical protein
LSAGLVCLPTLIEIHYPRRVTNKFYLGVDGESHSAPKIPTTINYNSKGSGFSWGASIDKLVDNIVGVKLLLDPLQEQPYYLPSSDIKRDIKKLPKPPVQVAADYIGAVYNHALSEISKDIPVNYMNLCEKEFVLSG